MGLRKVRQGIGRSRRCGYETGEPEPIDSDQDGLLDLYLVQSGATKAYTPPHPLRSALYHNNGDGTFTDVTAKAGVAGEGHYGSSIQTVT